MNGPSPQARLQTAGSLCPEAARTPAGSDPQPLWVPGFSADPVAGAGLDGAGPAAPSGGFGSSVWLVSQLTLTMQRRGRFVRESGQHPGRMSPALAAEAIRRFTDPGDVVLDPMCGIGTTLVEAVHAGRRAAGVECEARWVAIARDNIGLAVSQSVSRAGAAGAAGAGSAVVVTADARHLDDLHALPGRAGPAGPAGPAGYCADTGSEQAARAELARLRGRVKLLLTSPPYGPSTHGRVVVPGGDEPVVSHLHKRYTGYPYTGYSGRPGRPDPSGLMDPVAPAGGGDRGRGVPGRAGLVNLAHATSAELVSGLTEILAGCLPLLAPDAVVVVTARPWRRDGVLIDLPGLVAQAGEAAGLILADRQVAVLAGQDQSGRKGGRLIPRHSFLQLLQVRRARARGDDVILLSHEDLLIFVTADAGLTSRTRAAA